MVDEHFFFKNRQTLFWPSTNTFRELCFISVDEHFFLLHKISTNTFFTTMGLRIFFNISTHIDEHLMYYITLVIFSTFQHKSTNTFFLQRSMNTFWSCRNFSKCYVVTGRQTLFFYKYRQTLFFYKYRWTLFSLQWDLEYFSTLLHISTNT